MNIVIAVFAFIGICVVGVAAGMALFVGGLLLYDRIAISQMHRR